MRPRHKDRVPELPPKVYAAFKKDFQNGRVTTGDLCDANCFFCSQKWNPPGVIQSAHRLLTFEEIKYFIDRYLVHAEVIGAATHVNSGEFFFHPDASRILSYLARVKKLGRHATNLLTNGMDLTREHVRLIRSLNLQTRFSLNAPDASSRMALMGGSLSANERAIRSLDLLDKAGADYDVFIVPTRTHLKNGNLEAIFKNFRSHRMKRFRVHRPGYTRYTPAPIRKELTMSDDELIRFCSLMQKKYGKDVLFECIVPDSQRSAVLEDLVTVFARNRDYLKKRKLFLCSKGGHDFVLRAMNRMGMDRCVLKVVEPKVFGGNVDCAGLLLIDDYREAIEGFLKKNRMPEVLFLPRASFDINLEDLRMIPSNALKRAFRTELVLVGRFFA